MHARDYALLYLTLPFRDKELNIWLRTVTTTTRHQLSYFILEMSALILKHHGPLPVDVSLVLCAAALLPFSSHTWERTAAESSHKQQTQKL